MNLPPWILFGCAALVCVFGEAKQQLTFADVVFDNCCGRTNAGRAGGKFHPVAAPKTLRWLGQRAPCAVITSPQQENLDGAPGSDADTTESRWNHSTVIRYEQITRFQPGSKARER